jgi:hypothetical protein
MRENYGGNKRRREEAKRKKREEKRNKRLNNKLNAAPEAGITPEVLPGSIPAQENPPVG